ncbi:unnamed protein product [Trichobilharzia szidati]|nr:unnamed protein product [Trichobilharzia szidati]
MYGINSRSGGLPALSNMLLPHNPFLPHMSSSITFPCTNSSVSGNSSIPGVQSSLPGIPGPNNPAFLSGLAQSHPAVAAVVAALATAGFPPGNTNPATNPLSGDLFNNSSNYPYSQMPAHMNNITTSLPSGTSDCLTGASIPSPISSNTSTPYHGPSGSGAHTPFSPTSISLPNPNNPRPLVFPLDGATEQLPFPPMLSPAALSAIISDKNLDEKQRTATAAAVSQGGPPGVFGFPLNFASGGMVSGSGSLPGVSPMDAHNLVATMASFAAQSAAAAAAAGMNSDMQQD